MKNNIKLIALIIICFTLCGCSDSDEQLVNNIEEHYDTFNKISNEDVNEDNTITEQEIKDKYNEYGDMSWYSDENDAEDDIEEDVPENWNEQYKDSFESNIAIDTNKINVELSTYSWYEPVINDDFEYNINTHQWIAYAINEYFNGNVSQIFSCEIPNDIIESQTNMIFTVQVHGSNSNLKILLDLYNYQIVVSEE